MKKKKKIPIPLYINSKLTININFAVARSLPPIMIGGENLAIIFLSLFSWFTLLSYLKN